MHDERSILATKLRAFAAQLRFVPRTLRLAASAAGAWLFVWIAILAVQGLLPVALVFLTRTLIDQLSSAVSQPGAAEFAQVVPTLVALGTVMVLTEVLRGAASYVRGVQAELLGDHIAELVHAQSTAVDQAFFDMHEFHDHLYRAQWEATHRPLALLDSLGGLLQSGITLIGLGAVLATYGLWLPVVLLASTLPAFWTVLNFSLAKHRLRGRTTSQERRARYVNWLLTNETTAAELRLFDLGGLFRGAYRDIRAGLRRESLGLARRQLLGEATASLVALLLCCATMLWMVWRVYRAEATLGDLALSYQVFNQGQRMMHALLQQVAQVYYNSLFLSDLFAFLAIKPTIVEPPRAAPVPELSNEGIRFENVTFAYSRDRRPALAGFDMHLPAERIIALVGPNGAGKTTIVKLLCRLYDPQAGRVTFEGVDLRELSLGQLRRRVAVLFQEPVQYNATVEETIAYGDATVAADRARVEAAAKGAGAQDIIDSLPSRHDQLLGSWFQHGAQLSVGQWQRLGLARTLYRDASLVVLDEPTSAMDPWAEGEWLSRLRAATAGKTVVIITHRLTTAMHADLIHVLDQGRVVESGEHQSLLRRGGAYAAAWRQQEGAAEVAT